MAGSKEHITRLIHWSMALLVLTIITLGYYMENFKVYEYYALHKSLGVIVSVAILFRVYWRFTAPWISSAKESGNEKLVQLVHNSILVLLILMPITGMFLSGFGGFGVAIFGLELIPANYDEGGKVIPYSAVFSNFGYIAHEIISYLLSALLLLHLTAALKHHYYDKDATLRRMLGKS